jgi:hypothetical protein
MPAADTSPFSHRAASGPPPNASEGRFAPMPEARLSANLTDFAARPWSAPAARIIEKRGGGLETRAGQIAAQKASNRSRPNVNSRC